MATLPVVYDAVPAPDCPHDVISLGERTGARGVRAGPHMSGKWIYALVTYPAEQVIAFMFDQVKARNSLHARTWVVPAGGDHHQLQWLQAEAERRRARIHIDCDLIYVLEYPLGRGSLPAHRR